MTEPTIASPADIPTSSLTSTESLSLKEKSTTPDQADLEAVSSSALALPLEPYARPSPWGKLQLARLGLSFFLTAQVGMSDASFGALLSSIQTQYNLSYSLASLSSLANVIGWLVGCVLNIFVFQRLGFRATLTTAGALGLTGSVIMRLSLPFPAVILAMVLIGAASCTLEATLSTYVGHFQDGPLMSLLFAAYGVGAFVEPFIVATLLQHNVAWQCYYYVPSGLILGGLPLIWVTFNGYTQPREDAALQSAGRRFVKACRNWQVICGGAIVALSYGTTNTMSSWVVSFMISIRNGNQSNMRFVLSGFWGGQTAGRLFLAHLTSYIGERLALTIYLILAICSLAVMQFVAYIPGEAVGVALAGVFLGPVTPMVFSGTLKSLPPSLVSPAVLIMTAIGLVGSGISPVVVGFINSAGGLPYLAAIVMGLVAVMIPLGVLWAPRRPKESCAA